MAAEDYDVERRVSTSSCSVRRVREDAAGAYAGAHPHVPFAIADATALTEAGYVLREDVETPPKLIQAADFDIKKAETWIIYIDQVDKIARKVDNPLIMRDVWARACRLSETSRMVASVLAAGRSGASAPGVPLDRHDQYSFSTAVARSPTWRRSSAGG